MDHRRNMFGVDVIHNFPRNFFNINKLCLTIFYETVTEVARENYCNLIIVKLTCVTQFFIDTSRHILTARLSGDSKKQLK